MIRRHMLTGLVAVLVFGALLIAPQTVASLTPSASAQSCPDVEVIFARGRLESPGVGRLGNAFISALRSKTNKNIDV
ncbi:MAG: cutinase family protein, partial [Mycobacterium sp.]